MFLNFTSHDVDKLIEEYFEGMNAWKEFGLSYPEIFNVLKTCLAGCGRLIRPNLLMLSYQGYSPKPDERIARVAFSLELLHGFVLIHDDIIDRSEKRRSRPSLYREFDMMLSGFSSASSLEGKDLAIVAGDMIYATALNIFQRETHAFETGAEALNMLTETALLTGQGEMMELLEPLKPLSMTTEEKIWEIYDLKTSQYTFCCPLSLGALLSGKNSGETEKLMRMGKFLGRAYQMMDDLNGIIHPDVWNASGKMPDDLAERKRTFLFLQASMIGIATEKEFVTTFAEGRHNSPDDMQKMLGILSRPEILSKAAEKIKEFKNQAFLISEELNMNIDRRRELINYLDELMPDESLNGFRHEKNK